MYVLAPNQAVETFPYSIGALRRDNPNVSFPRKPSNEVLAAWNVFPVIASAMPACDPATETCTQVDPTLVNGEWVATYEVTTADAAEIAERLEAESEMVRMTRDQLLTACDWTQLPDSPLSTAEAAAWATYRQELRDLPSSAGFPFTVTWPSKPA